MAQQRIPLSQPIETRNGQLNTDSKCVNGYFETRDNKREFVKRPGLTAQAVTPAFGAVDAQGMYLFKGYLYCILNNVVYKVNPSTYVSTTIGTITGAVVNCYFVQTLNDGYLFFHNQTNGYLINGNTGAFTQITNDKVATTTIITGGSGYVTPLVIFGISWTATSTYSTGQQIAYGANLYTVTIGGTTASTAPTFTSGSQTDGTATLTYAGTRAQGTVQVNTGVVTGITITNAGSGYTYAPLVTILDGTGPGIDATATCLLNFFPTGGLVPGAVFIDSYVAVGTPSGRIYTSNVGDPTIWNPLDYVTAEGEPDNSVGISKHLNYVLDFGQWSTEFFYDAANTVGSPLSPAPSYRIEIGCINGNSICQFEQSVIWVGVSKATGTGVYIIDGVTPVKVSTPYIDRILGNSNFVDVNAYTFKFNGHMLYVLTMHDLNKTLVFDVNEKMWYQWTMWAIGDATSGVPGIYAEQYFRPNYFAGDGETYYFLDDDNGMLYIMSDLVYNDAGAPIYYRSVTDLIDNGTTKRKFYQRVEIVGDKVPATMNIRHSDDDYNSWSPYRTVNLNEQRSQIYQTGQARRRAWEFLCTDNQPLRLDFAEIDFGIGGLDEEGGQPTQYRK